MGEGPDGQKEDSPAFCTSFQGKLHKECIAVVKSEFTDAWISLANLAFSGRDKHL